MQDEEVPIDQMPYETLSYANGPGHGRINLTGVDTSQYTTLIYDFSYFILFHEMRCDRCFNLNICLQILESCCLN